MQNYMDYTAEQTASNLYCQALILRTMRETEVHMKKNPAIAGLIESQMYSGIVRRFTPAGQA